MGVESYKHQFAKATLAGWFREIADGNVDDYVGIDPVRWRVNRSGPNFGVWTEYPIAVDKDQIPAEKIESEKRIYAEQVKESGKPAHLVDKIVEGKLEAFYKEACLLYQPWVRDDKQTIGELVKAASGKTGEKVEIRRFVRFQMGEG